jgi:uncharacterized membrane protein
MSINITALWGLEYHIFWWTGTYISEEHVVTIIRIFLRKMGLFGYSDNLISVYQTVRPHTPDYDLLLFTFSRC